MPVTIYVLAHGCINTLARSERVQHYVWQRVCTSLPVIVQPELNNVPPRISVTLISRLLINIQEPAEHNYRPETYMTSTMFSFNRDMTDMTTQETGTDSNHERSPHQPPRVHFELTPRDSRRNAEASSSSGLTSWALSLLSLKPEILIRLPTISRDFTISTATSSELRTPDEPV